MSGNRLSSAFICAGVLFALSGNLSQAQVGKNKTTTLSGRVYRSDASQPVSGAKIYLMKSREISFETTTDEKGNYSLGQLKAGKYLVRINVRYNKITDSPCSIFGSRVTADKGSDVAMKDEGLGWVDVTVSIDNFRITTGKPNTKDFDVACKGTYRNQ
ncbi:MAG TPA: carboxypeptidase-like regulatory domain-containing protein [Blastocatellia bacterium]|nr:carboxypeptidase-like regulatory domain-containing protein [Blastocatellia bacterium]